MPTTVIDSYTTAPQTLLSTQTMLITADGLLATGGTSITATQTGSLAGQLFVLGHHYQRRLSQL